MTTPSERRNELARQRGFMSAGEQRRHQTNVRNRLDLAALPAGAQYARQQALEALNIVRRDGLDLPTVATRLGTTPEAVAFWAGDTVVRRRDGWHVAPGDRLLRTMYVYSGGQAVSVDVRGSRKASAVGRYHAAVQHYLNTGDAARLLRFQGATVNGVELETDIDVIDELARRGSFDFESIYRMVS